MPAVSFHLFPMLAPELRCRIWQLALSMPSVLQVKHLSANDDEATLGSDRWIFQYLAWDPARNIGRTCIESRTVLQFMHSRTQQSPTITDQPRWVFDPSRLVFHMGSARQAYETLQARPSRLYWENISRVSLVWTQLLDVVYVFRELSWLCATRCAVYVFDSGPAEATQVPGRLSQREIELLETMVEEGHHSTRKPVHIPMWLVSGEVVDQHGELAFYMSDRDLEAPTLTFLPMETP